MKNKEMIADFLNKVVAGDSEAAKAAFSLYCNSKAMSIGNSEKVMEHVEQFKTTLVEYGNAQAAKTATESPLRMEGDKILVNNKMVGRIQYDIEDFDGGINFISDDGSFSKEFQSAEELFSFLSTKYLGDGNV